MRFQLDDGLNYLDRLKNKTDSKTVEELLKVSVSLLVQNLKNKRMLNKARTSIPDALEEIRITEISRTLSLREKVVTFLLCLLGFSTIACISLFFFNGFGLTNLSDKAIMALTTATVSQVAALLVIAVKFLFSKNR